MTNVLKCKTCNVVLTAKAKHDFVTCNCPDGSDTRVSIDGGDHHSVIVHGHRAQWEKWEVDEEIF